MGKEKDLPKEEVFDANLEKEVGGIEESLDKDVQLNKEAIKAAAEKIEKQRKDTKLEDAQRAIYKKEYMIELQKLHMRKMRRQEAASKKFMIAIGDKEGLGKDLLEGKLDSAEFDKKIAEAIKAKNDAYKEADKVFADYKVKMDKKYECYWHRGWNDPVW